MDTKETDIFYKSYPKETVVLKEFLYRAINYQFRKFHESDIHYSGCQWPPSGPEGLKH